MDKSLLFPSRLLRCGTCMAVAGLLVSCNPSGQQSLSPPPPPEPIPAPETTTENPLKVAPVIQEKMMSCWAACGEMVMGYVRLQSTDWQGVPAPRQCQQMTNRYSADCAGCCDGQLNMICAGLSGEPQFDASWNFSCQEISNKPLSWADLTSEIDSHRPVAFSWKKDGGGEHLEVLIGYDANSDGQWVTYLDPVYQDLADVSVVMYSEYCCSTVSTHLNDFYQIAVVGRPSQ